MAKGTRYGALAHHATLVQEVLRMLPALHAEGLVDAVDVFCERMAFSPAQTLPVRGKSAPVCTFVPGRHAVPSAPVTKRKKKKKKKASGAAPAASG